MPNIQQYWSLPPQQKNVIFNDVIKPIERCEECRQECSEDGATCWWCEATVCPKHFIIEQWQGFDIPVCNGCHEWEEGQW